MLFSIYQYWRPPPLEFHLTRLFTRAAVNFGTINKNCQSRQNMQVTLCLYLWSCKSAKVRGAQIDISLRRCRFVMVCHCISHRINFNTQIISHIMYQTDLYAAQKDINTTFSTNENEIIPDHPHLTGLCFSIMPSGVSHRPPNSL